jgi:penicillin-binding protein 2
MEYIDEKGDKHNKLLDLAKQWGFNEYGEVSHQFELEYPEHYSFVSSAVFNDEDIFNFALGQGKTQASPYLINNIVNAIANGGKSTELYIVDNITDPAGNDRKNGFESVFDLGLTPETVATLQEMMRLTCSIGTGTNNTLAPYGGLAGKTGTAQNATPNEHSWFSGYFPANKPMYAMTVFIEEGGSSKNALELYDKLANLLFSLHEVEFYQNLR